MPLSSLVELCLDQVASDFRLYAFKLAGLPRELEEMLMSRLRDCGKVTDGQLLHFLTLQRLELHLAGCGYIRNSILLMIGQRCPQLEVLDLTDCRQVSNRVVRGILQGCPNLRQLVLDGCLRVTDSAFLPRPFQLSAALPTLEVLGFSRCTQVTEESLVCFVKGCPNIRFLSLSHCKNVTDSAVQLLLEGCRSLQTLDLSFCEAVTDQAFTHLTEGSLTALHQLMLDKCRLTDCGLASVARASPSLKLLSVCWCMQLSDASVQLLAAHCPALTSLSLGHCGAITDTSLLALAQHAPQLTALDISWCRNVSDTGLVTLAQHLPLLSTLNISLHIPLLAPDSSSPSISPLSIIMLASLCPALSCLKLDGHAQALTDEALSQLGTLTHLQSLGLQISSSTSPPSFGRLSQCKKLTSLQLSFSLMTALQMEAVSTHFASFACLASLCLRSDVGLTDQVLRSVSGGCPALVELELDGCSSVTDSSFQDLATLRSLRRFCMVTAPHVTNSAIDTLAAGCVSLTVFKVVNCPLLTDDSLLLLALCKSLRSVTCRLCPRMSDSAFQALRSKNVDVIT
eukprot:GILI01014263.1.p1 GENE.GILI01014263.1~~GILI01014263.1.p1  ORF type:complete len:569 (+),score=118.45 GILI01014263.1:51-1757(+)